MAFPCFPSWAFFKAVFCVTQPPQRVTSLLGLNLDGTFFGKLPGVGFGGSISFEGFFNSCIYILCMINVVCGCILWGYVGGILVIVGHGVADVVWLVGEISDVLVCSHFYFRQLKVSLVTHLREKDFICSHFYMMLKKVLHENRFDCQNKVLLRGVVE